MQPTQTSAENRLTIPLSVVSPMDIARLIRELENLDEFFVQAAIRQGGTPVVAPRYSRLLDDLVLTNRVNLLDAKQREIMLGLLRQFAKYAPVLHVSFSADPPGTYVQKIVAWLRENIHPEIIVRVGLQPNIGAGCVVRTPNHSFDFSLRQFFDSKHEFFMEKLHEVVAPELQAEPVAEPVAVVTTPEPAPTVIGGTPS